MEEVSYVTRTRKSGFEGLLSANQKRLIIIYKPIAGLESVHERVHGNQGLKETFIRQSGACSPVTKLKQYLQAFCDGNEEKEVATFVQQKSHGIPGCKRPPRQQQLAE